MKACRLFTLEQARTADHVGHRCFQVRARPWRTRFFTALLSLNVCGKCELVLIIIIIRVVLFA